MAKPKTPASERLRNQAQRMGTKALKALESIALGEGQDAVKLAAAREILDRGFGRPKLGGGETESEGMTVIVKQFTDPPEDQA